MENEARYCRDCAYYQDLPKGPRGGEYGVCGSARHNTGRRPGLTRCCKDFEDNKAAAKPEEREEGFIEPKGFSEPATVEIIWYLQAKRKELENTIGSGSLATDAKLKSNIALLDEIIDWIEAEGET
jgi:hypothetical protein